MESEHIPCSKETGVSEHCATLAYTENRVLILSINDQIVVYNIRKDFVSFFYHVSLLLLYIRKVNVC